MQGVRCGVKGGWWRVQRDGGGWSCWWVWQGSRVSTRWYREGGFKKNEITDWVAANWPASNQSLVAWMLECIMYTIHPPYIRAPVESSRCIPIQNHISLWALSFGGTRPETIIENERSNRFFGISRHSLTILERPRHWTGGGIARIFRPNCSRFVSIRRLSVILVHDGTCKEPDAGSRSHLPYFSKGWFFWKNSL